MKRLPVFAVALGLAGSLLVLPSPASAQVRVGIGVGVGRPIARRYYRPYYDNWYWYPDLYWGYYQYPYPAYPPYYGPYATDTASLRLDVKPKETQVFVDGYYAGTVDDFDGLFQRLNLEPGEHELALYLPGYRLQRQRVYLQSDHTFKVHYTMVPLAPGESEPVRPAPAAAPSGSALPPQGPSGPVTRGPQRPLPPRDRDGRREPPPPPPDRNGAAADYGTLALRVQPGVADLTIDGEKWEGSSGDSRLLVQLSAGVHHVEARKEGYRIYVTDVTIRPGETATLNVALSRQP